MNSEKQSVVREERARRGSNPWMLPALGLDTKSEIVKFYKVLSKRQKHFYRKDSMQDGLKVNITDVINQIYCGRR